MTVDPLPPQVLENHRIRLTAFVRRALRIEAHSLVKGTALLQWLGAQGTVTVDGSRREIEWRVPPEEAFESLVSRCRPLLLDGDGIFYPSVLGSLKAFVRSDPEQLRRIEILRNGWDRALHPEFPAMFGQAPVGERPVDLVSHAVLAEQWLNGDLVHADQPGNEALAGTTLN